MQTTTRTTEGWQIAGSSAEAYEEYLASAFSPWARGLVALAGVQSGDRVLDVACGTGIVARHAAEVVGPGGRVAGVDLNADMLRVARKVAADTGLPVEWHEANAASLPFPDGSFDAAIAEQGIQFFADPVAALAEMRRVLAPGGRVVLSVCRPLQYAPTYAALASALDRHVGADAGAMMRSPFCRWTREEVRRLFADAGFETADVRIEVGALRYPSVEEFVRREVLSSPLAGPVGALTGAARTALIDEVASTVADHVDDEGVVCPIEAYVVLAR